jgi:SAM-dependent methyltransferase
VVSATLVGGTRLKPLDRLLRYWRILKVRPFIPRGARVLDIGCFDGTLFRVLRKRITSGVGVDPALSLSLDLGAFQFVDGRFPLPLPSQEPFDAIALLAVLEHVDTDAITDLRDRCVDLLAPGGVVLVTVPSPAVDHILEGLQRLHLVAGIALHEHHGFDPKSVPPMFADRRLRLTVARRFQLGLNNLFVFTRSA